MRTFVSSKTLPPIGKAMAARRPSRPPFSGRKGLTESLLIDEEGEGLVDRFLLGRDPEVSLCRIDLSLV
jgi:hypothetical protein